ncbi:hypothetical protein RA267_27840, partial [Pseudomonas syringae pv. tagetis]|uniref:hypothetical protein n=1 Tax=Pseudomonas syringae group genomosp. 7 TaxID=251699 RepID=UPI00376F4830
MGWGGEWVFVVLLGLGVVLVVVWLLVVVFGGVVWVVGWLGCWCGVFGWGGGVVWFVFVLCVLFVFLVGVLCGWFGFGELWGREVFVVVGVGLGGHLELTVFSAVLEGGVCAGLCYA